MNIDTLPAKVDGYTRIEIVALEDNTLLGTARIEDPLSRPTLVDLYVDHERREEGIAQQLVKKGMEWARTTGKTLYLYVNRENRKARGLYEKLGWSYFRLEDEKEINVEQRGDGKTGRNGRVWMRWTPTEKLTR